VPCRLRFFGLQNKWNFGIEMIGLALKNYNEIADSFESTFDGRFDIVSKFN